MDDVPSNGIAEPVRWQICFTRQAQNRWINRLVPGRFKHVRAFGFVPSEGVWVFYDVSLSGTVIRAARDKSAMQDRLIEAWIADSEVLSITRQTGRRSQPPGFWCVTAVRHLVGVPGGALLPDGLYRNCLRHGAKALDEQVAAADAGHCAAA